MKTKLKVIFLIFGLILFSFSGCAIYSTGEIDQPELVAPSTLFDVYLLNYVTLYDSLSTLTYNFEAESLLVSPVLPSGWTVNSAKLYVETDIYKIISGYNDMDVDSSVMASIIDSIENNMSSMASTDIYDDYVQAQYNLNGRTLNSLAGIANIDLPIGTEMDTVFEDTSGTVEGLEEYYIKMIATLVKISITSSSQEGNYSLGYISALNPSSQDSLLWIYSEDNPIEVNENIGIEKKVLNSVNKPIFYITPNPAVSDINILCSNKHNENTVIKIYNIKGQELLKRQFSSASYNKLNISDLNSGAYIVKIETQKTSMTKRLTIVK